MRDTGDALAWLHNQAVDPTQSWYRLCLGLARSARGIDSRYLTAYSAWLHAGGKHALTPASDWHHLPKGAPVFYKGAPFNGTIYGHVATFAGVTQIGPLVWSNDVLTKGRVNAVHPLWFLTHWGHDLLGWTESLNGVDLNLDTPEEPPPPVNSVSLAIVQTAARLDPHRVQGGKTGAGKDVLTVERALVRLGYLLESLADGAFGSSTVAAYQHWQRYLGYADADADGMPGWVSLSRLGARFGFPVTA